MNGTAAPALFAVDCSNCGRPTVTSDLCERPDLCYPCFAATPAPMAGEEESHGE